MKRPGKRLAGLLVTLLTMGVLPALAQDGLLDRVPSDAVLVFGAQYEPGVLGDLREDLAALDWEGAFDTLEAIAQEELELPSLEEYSPSAVLSQFCPPLEPAVRSLEEGAQRLELLAAVRLQNGEPLPALALHFPGTEEQTLDDLQAAFEECGGSPVFPADAELERPLLLGALGIPGLVIGISDDGTLAFATSPEEVVPFLGEQQEAPGLIARALADFGAGGSASSLTFGIDMQALAGVLEGELDMGGGFRDPLERRLVDALMSLESIAAQVRVDDTGVLSQTRVLVNEAGPDEELIDLLLCTDCELPEPGITVPGYAGMNVHSLSVRDLVDYIDGFVSEASGESLESLAGPEAFALLSQLDGGMYAYTLEPFGVTLDSLLYGPAQVLVLPVGSALQAQASLDALARRAQAQFRPDDVPFDIRSATLGDLEYQRLRFAFNVDLGLALIGDNLVIASPSSALRFVSEGEPALARPQLPANVAEGELLAYGVHDYSADLRGLAALFSVLEQPAAAAIQIGLEERSYDAQGFWGSSDLTGAVIVPLMPGLHEGNLSYSDEASSVVGGELSAVYSLEGVSPGDEVTVTLESEAFDTYLYLLTPEGEILDLNDDDGSTSRSRLTFTAQPGQEYLVRVSSFFGEGEGPFTLDIQREAGEVPVSVAEEVAFGDLLTLLGMPGAVLDVLANHIGKATSFQVREAGGIYSRSFLEFSGGAR